MEHALESPLPEPGRSRLTAPAAVWTALVVMVVAGLSLRLLLTSSGVFLIDAQIFRGWAVRLVSAPLGDFYAANRTADHLPGDLWLLWGIAHLYHWMSPTMAVQQFRFLFMLKLVPSLADAGIGVMLFLIARRLAGPRAGLLAAAGWLFNPASIFLSATWGQWDSVSAFAMVTALWLLLRGNPAIALPVLTYAALVKPQLGVLLLLLALAWWCWSRAGNVPGIGRPARELPRLALGVTAALAVFLAIDLPFNVGLPGLPARYTVFERLSVALNRFQTASENAFNLWGILAHGRASQGVSDSQTFLLFSYRLWGELLLGAVILAALALFWRRPRPEIALWSALAIAFALFMLPTRVHERYLLPAVVLAVLCAAVMPGLRWVAALLTFSYLANIYAVYAQFGALGIDGPHQQAIILSISALNLFLFLVVLAFGLTLATLPRELPEPGALAVPATGPVEPLPPAAEPARPVSRPLQAD